MMIARLVPVSVVLLGGACASAQPITVVNHSFEANFAAPNSFPVLIPTGWQRFDPGNIIDQNRDALGVLNPTGGTYFPAGAPDGSNVALVYLEGDRGTTPAGLVQPLAAALLANSRYELRVEVGNIASGVGAPPFNFFFNLDGFPGYAVQLLAGGVVIAEDFNTLAAVIAEGEFRTSIVTLDVGTAHARLGQQLAVRVINLNIVPPPPAPGIEVDFDNVRLGRTALPTCPADFNGDGTLDPDDLADYIGAYFAAPAGAGSDFNADGNTDPDDLADFIGAFFSGC